MSGAAKRRISIKLRMIFLNLMKGGFPKNNQQRKELLICLVWEMRKASRLVLPKFLLYGSIVTRRSSLLIETGLQITSNLNGFLFAGRDFAPYSKSKGIISLFGLLVIAVTVQGPPPANTRGNFPDTQGIHLILQFF